MRFFWANRTLMGMQLHVSFRYQYALCEIMDMSFYYSSYFESSGISGEGYKVTSFFFEVIVKARALVP